jgi:GNAT superfamily N-acetyltransferase
VSGPQLSDDEVEIVEPKTDEEWEDYYRIRWERLRKPLGLPLESVRDDPLEPSSEHRVVKVDGKVVAAVCWIVGVRKEGARRIMYIRWRQLGVEPDFEGRGIGGILMRYREDYARKLGVEELVANPRLENVPWFKRHGWEVVGEGVKLYDQVESVSMVKRLRG